MDFIIICKVASIFGIKEKWLELLNTPRQIIPAANDWWAVGHGGGHVSVDQVQIANMAWELTAGGI
jgi:hypothetical protein